MKVGFLTWRPAKFHKEVSKKVSVWKTEIEGLEGERPHHPLIASGDGRSRAKVWMSRVMFSTAGFCRKPA